VKDQATSSPGNRAQDHRYHLARAFRLLLCGIRFRPSLTLLTLLTLMGIGLRVRYFGGLQGSDDLSHAYGGYFFFRNFHKGFVPYHGPISSLRIGLDFLLWISQSIFGVHEWSAGLVPFVFSLLGIWAIYLLGRRVAGETAGLAAAAFLTFLPLDVYLAGIWLQDTVLNTLLIASTIWFIRSLEAESPRGAVGWGLLSGVGIGYAAIVKSIAPMVLVAFGIWSLFRVRGDRRVLRVMWVVAGFLLMMGVGAVYWHLLTGDPLFNVRMLAAQHRVINSLPTTADTILFGFPRMILRRMPFGPALLLTPAFVVIFAFARSIRYRWLILTLFAVLWLSLMKAAQMEVQQRYLMLVVPPLIIIAAGGLSVIVRPLPKHLGYGILAAAAALTLVGFQHCPQNWNYAGGVPLRSVHRILALANTADAPVFADPRVLLILYQLNGFRPYPGGLYRYPTQMPTHFAQTHWHDPFVKAFDDRYGVAPDGFELRQRRRGWVVFHERIATKFDKDYWKLPMPQLLWDPPGNWTVVASYREPRLGSRITLYLIRPGPPSFEEPSLSRLVAHRTAWARGVVADSVTISEQGLSYRATVEPARSPADRRWVGVKLLVDSDAFRLQMAFPPPEEIEAVYVYACDGSGAQIAWHADGADLPPAGESRLYTFVPGEPSGPFIVTRMSPSNEIESVDVFVEPTPEATSAGFTISKVEMGRY